jgi:hypothetical protein
MPQFLAELVGDDTCNDISRAAGREWHNEANGFVWISLRAGDCWDDANHSSRDETSEFENIATNHVSSSDCFH